MKPPVILFVIFFLSLGGAAYGFAQALVLYDICKKDNFPVVFISFLAVLFSIVVIFTRKGSEESRESSS